MVKNNLLRKVSALILIVCMVLAIVPTAAFAAVGSDGLLTEVYLDGTTAGDDTKDGSTPANAVKTFERAKELLSKTENGATIYIKGKVTITAGTAQAPNNVTWSLEGYNNAKVERYSEFKATATLIQPGNNSNVIFENIIIDGGNIQTTGASPLIMGAGAASYITLGSGAVLRNNLNGTTGGGISINSNTLYINGGVIENNTAGTADGGDGIYFNGGKIYLNSGLVQGGTNGAISMQGKATASLLSIGDGFVVDGTIIRNGSDAAAAFGIAVTGTLSNNITVVPKGTTPITESTVVATGSSYALTEADRTKFVWGGYKDASGNLGTDVRYFVLDTVNNQIKLTATAPATGGGGDTGGGSSYTSGDLTVNYFANYGGEVTVDGDGEFTVTATATGYVIDTICVDGIPLGDVQGEADTTYSFIDGTDGTHSIVATFAYTLSFNTPTNGTLSVSRGSDSLTSGDIVRGGEVLTITTNPNANFEVDEFNIVGLTRIGTMNTYTVTALQGDPAPSIFVSFKSSVVAPEQPVMSSGSIIRTSDTTATISFYLTSSATGWVYILEQSPDEDAPTKEAVSAGTNIGIADNSFVYSSQITLQEGTRAIYVVVSIPGNTPVISDVLRLDALPPAPVLSGGSASRTSDTEVTISFTSDKAGTAYYFVQEYGAEAPEKDAIRAANNSLGSVAVGNNSNLAVTLTAGKKDVYVVVVSAAEIISEPLKLSVNVPGAPKLSDGSISRSTETNATIGFTSDTNGEVFYVVQNSGVSAPTRENVKNSGISLGAVSAEELSGDLDEEIVQSAYAVRDLAVTLTAGAKDVYVVVASEDGKISDTLKLSIGVAQYIITIDGVSNGTITPSKATPYAAGETVTVTAIPSEGYALAPASLRYELAGSGGSLALIPKTAILNVYPNNPEPAPLTFTFTMPAGSVSLSAEFYDATAAWTGTGEVGSQYLITSKEDMQALAAAVNGGAAFGGKHFKLMTNLTLDSTWVGIGNLEYLRPFSGAFDGDGHTVTLENYSASMGQGVFGYVRNGTIKNLTSAGHIFADGAINVAGIVGYLFDGAVENCVNRADITVNGKTGGIVGAYRGTITVTDSDNYGNISGGNGSGKQGNIGGILGYNDASGYFVPTLMLDISGCRNYGDVTEQWLIAGGIVGGINTFGATVQAGYTVDITDCLNYGNITVVQGGNVGGILGNGSADEINITNSGNNGEIKGYSRIGGIVGYAGAGTILYLTKLNIDSCFNSGYLYGERMTGGIVGETTNPAWLSNIYNTGTIEQKPFYSTTSIGGLIGNDGDIRSFFNAYNVGKLVPVSAKDIALLSVSSYGNRSNLYYVPQARDDDEDVLIPAVAGVADGNSVYAVSIEQLAALSAELGSAWVDDIGLNDGLPILAWQANTTIHDVTTTVTAPTEAQASLKINSKVKASGAVTPIVDNGKASFSLTVLKQYEITSFKVGGQAVTSYTSETEGLTTTYSYSTTVTGALTVEITVVKKTVDDSKDGNSGGAKTESSVPAGYVWDGKTVDLTWFDPAKYVSTSSYPINSSAKLMGVSALVNGLINEDCIVYLWDKTTMTAAEWNASEYVITDDGNSHIGEGENLSTETYHFGKYDFTNKTIYLTSDIDMGGVYSYGSWYGPNFMPIGGQYLMTPYDSTTKLSSSFNGNFDGGGHFVYNIYCSRNAGSTYGDGASVGLIGRLGVHDNDPTNLRPTSPTVSNVAVTGYIYANRSVAGIVGKIGKTAYNNGNTSGGAVIENCANYAMIRATDGKGTGGIVGASFNGGVVRNCYNAGEVIGGWPAGGVVGSNEIIVENCYNVGQVSSNHGDSFAMGIGTMNGSFGHSVHNNYFLEGSAPGGGYYTNGSIDSTGERTAGYMKGEDFVALLGGAFTADTGYNAGYPILKAITYTEKIEDDGKGTGTGDTDKTEDTDEPNVAGTSEVKTDPAKVEVKDDTVTATTKVETTEVKTAVDEAQKAVDAAKKADPKANVVGEVKIVIKPEEPKDGETAPKVTETVAEIPAAAIKLIADAHDLILTVESELASVTLDNKTLTELVKGVSDTETIRIDVSIADNKTALTEEQQKLVGDSPVIEADVYIGSTKVHDFGGTVTVSVPYTPPATIKAEDYDLLTVYFLNDKGELTEIFGAKYDPKTGLLTFKTNHFSTFVLREWINPFSDVARDSWYYKAVRYGYSNELVKGIGDGKFAPNLNLTRAQLVTILARQSGVDTTGGATWYEQALTWGVSSGITDGTNPELNISREQVAAMVYRYAGSPATSGNLSKFSDADKVSDWAEEAMKWAVETGLFIGDGGKLNPLGNATRAEIVTILERYLGAK